jgi:excisionase family DNA binding protein
MNTLLTEEEVAECLHVSLASIRRWRLERRGPQFIKVGSLVRYRPEDLESWLASLPTGGAQPAQAPTTSGSRQCYRGTVKVMSS